MVATSPSAVYAGRVRALCSMKGSTLTSTTIRIFWREKKRVQCLLPKKRLREIKRTAGRRCSFLRAFCWDCRLLLCQFRVRSPMSVRGPAGSLASKKARNWYTFKEAPNIVVEVHVVVKSKQNLFPNFFEKLNELSARSHGKVSRKTSFQLYGLWRSSPVHPERRP